MTTIPSRTQKVLTQLEDGTEIYVEVEYAAGSRQDVSNRRNTQPGLPFGDISSALESIVKSVAKPINAARPTKASVEFGLEIAVNEGQLIAALVRSSGTANLKITLEWEHQQKDEA